MATLYISEYARMGVSADGQSVPIAGELVGKQTRSLSGSSAQSAAFAKQTRYVRLHTDAVCSFLIGDNPTATTSDARLAADQTEYFEVRPDQKVAAITNT